MGCVLTSYLSAPVFFLFTFFLLLLRRDDISTYSGRSDFSATNKVKYIL